MGVCVVGEGRLAGERVPLSWLCNVGSYTTRGATVCMLADAAACQGMAFGGEVWGDGRRGDDGGGMGCMVGVCVNLWCITYKKQHTSYINTAQRSTTSCISHI